MPRFNGINAFKIPAKIVDPGRIMYLVIQDALIKEWANIIKIEPTEKFFEMIREQVIAHVYEKKNPPEEIQSAIMNISDDVMAERDVTIRTGDYIQLMNYARKNKIV